MSTASSPSRMLEEYPQDSASPHAHVSDVPVVVVVSSVDGDGVIVLTKTSFINPPGACQQTDFETDVCQRLYWRPEWTSAQLSLLQDPNKRK